MATRSVTASTACPTVAYSALVPAKNQIIGSFAVSLTSPHQGCVDASTRSLSPYTCARFAASTAVRPARFHRPSASCVSAAGVRAERDVGEDDDEYQERDPSHAHHAGVLD